MRPVSFWERYSIQKHAGDSERLTNASAGGCWPLSQERGLCKKIQSETVKPHHLFHLMSVCNLSNRRDDPHFYPSESVIGNKSVFTEGLLWCASYLNVSIRSYIKN